MAMAKSLQDNDACGKTDESQTITSFFHADYLHISHTQLIALEYLHAVDIVHCDLDLGNMAFGDEPEPKNKTERKEDVLYDTDVFVFGKV